MPPSRDGRGKQVEAARVQEELARADFDGYSSDETVRCVMSGNQVRGGAEKGGRRAARQACCRLGCGGGSAGGRQRAGRSASAAAAVRRMGGHGAHRAGHA